MTWLRRAKSAQPGRILADQDVRPRLTVIRTVPHEPRLPLPGQPWWDRTSTGVAIVVSLLVGAVLACVGMGWVHL